MRLRVLVVTMLLVAAAPAAAQEREPLDIRVFAKIGPPGQPEPIAVGPDERVYVGTNQLGHGDTDAPSKVFAFSLDGTPVREYVIEGQPLEQSHGIQGLLFDANGLLYALDRSADPRVIVLDPFTGEQRRYASFKDVPPCSGAPDGSCSATRLDGPAGPDYAAFSPSGEMYVSDIDQGLIWRVPKGGGEAQVWLTDPRMESLYGPNGIQFMADERTLLFVNTASNPNAGNAATGRLYTVPVNPDGTPGEMKQVWESRPLDAPDGIAIARSGNVYVALAGSNQVLKLGPDYKELARAPRDPAANEREEIPLDGPGSLAFEGERLLVSNHSPIRGEESSWAVLDVFAGEAGLPLHLPQIEPPRLRLDARWIASRSKRRLRVRARVTRTLASSVVPVEGAVVRGPRRARARTGAQGTAILSVPRRVGRPFLVDASKPGFATAQDPVGRR